LPSESYLALSKRSADIVISAGSSLAVINYIISSQSQARSIVLMRPGLFSARRFDLVIAPEHDRMPRMRNIIETKGSLNPVDEKYLEEETGDLIATTGYHLQREGLYLGVLIGGDNKDFHLKRGAIKVALKQLKQAAAKLDAGILVTTSRRTSGEIERIVREEFEGESRCRLLIIANEKNINSAVGGILGLSSVVITTPESISMVSEAASSGKYNLVLDLEGIKGRHKSFIRTLARGGYIYLTKVSDLQKRIEDLWSEKPDIKILRDRSLVREAVEKIL